MTFAHTQFMQQIKKRREKEKEREGERERKGERASTGKKNIKNWFVH